MSVWNDIKNNKSNIIKSITGVISGSLLMKKDMKIIIATIDNTAKNFFLSLLFRSMFKNFNIRFIRPLIIRITAKDKSNKFKFIASDGRSGRIFGSLK